MIFFRAWHKKNKQMYDVAVINFIEKTAELIDIDKNINVGFSEIELMQKMDIDGIELYEDDIFIVDNLYPFYNDNVLNYVGYVGLDNDGWFYELSPISDNVRGLASGKSINELIEQCNIKDIHVIGNTFKNMNIESLKKNIKKIKNI